MLLVEGGTRVTQLAEGLRTVPREENRRFAQTIADVVELATLRVNEELAISGDLDKAARIPVVEVSLLLDVSRTMAGVYIDNGRQLRDHSIRHVQRSKPATSDSIMSARSSPHSRVSTTSYSPASKPKRY
ncbi:hypothetical protein [Williamsia sp. R60]